MVSYAEVPVVWFGDEVPRVGDVVTAVVTARVSEIKQEQVDIMDMRSEPDVTPTIGGMTKVTLVLTSMKVPS